MRRFAFAGLALLVIGIGAALVIPSHVNKPDARSILIAAAQAAEEAEAMYTFESRNIATLRKDGAKLTRDLVQWEQWERRIRQGKYHTAAHPQKATRATIQAVARRLEQEEPALRAVTARLEQRSRELAKAKSRLARFSAQLRDRSAELKSRKSEIDGAVARLRADCAKLDNAQRDLTILQRELAAKQAAIEDAILRAKRSTSK